jgi:hypothetical protein
MSVQQKTTIFVNFEGVGRRSQRAVESSHFADNCLKRHEESRCTVSIPHLDDGMQTVRDFLVKRSARS